MLLFHASNTFCLNLVISLPPSHSASLPTTLPPTLPFSLNLLVTIFFLIFSIHSLHSMIRILSSFQDVLNSFPVEVDNVLIVQTKYVASVQEVDNDSDELARLTFTINSNFGRKNSTLNAQSIDFEETMDPAASIVLPQSILNSFSDNGTDNDTDLSSSRIIFSVYNTEKLFFRPNTISEREKYLLVGSVIVSASVFYDGVYNTSVTGLDEPVIVTLRKNEVSTITLCVFHEIYTFICI